MAYWRLFYHFIWCTKDRAPLITPTIEPHLHRFLHSEANKLHVPLFVINGVADHVHVLAALRPSISPADFTKQLKGSSSRFISMEYKIPFEWQAGYGVLSVSEGDIQRVLAYIQRQKEHHQQGDLTSAWEETDDWNRGVVSSA